jgi:uncharacterized damage-inducible protein DinB
MSEANALRAHVAKALEWGDAHVDFDAAVKDLPPALRGKRAAGLPYSVWELVEHMRIAQHDILDFCVNPKYVEMAWPKDYWPASPAPASDAAWDASCAAFHKDCAEAVRLANDASIDLSARIPHGSGQTYLRELLLIVDHNAYHLGEIVAVRRLLGAWR